MSSTFEIATFEDWSALIVLEENCFIRDKLSAGQIKNFLLKKNARIIIRREDKKIVAAAILLFREHSKVVRLYSFAVSPQSRNQGLGLALLNFIENFLVGTYRELKLEVRSDNQPAIKLYQKGGFHETGIIENYYEDGCSALQFRKTLIKPHEIETM